MKKTSILIAAACLSALSSVCGQTQIIDDVARGTRNPSDLQRYVPMLDGTTYAVLTPDGKRVEQYEYKSGKLLATLFDASRARGASLPKIDSYSFDARQKNMFVATKSRKTPDGRLSAEYYIFDVQRNKLHQLTDSATLKSNPVFSPNGRNIIFAMGNDIFLKKMDYDGIVMQVTRNGSPDSIYNAVPDYTYSRNFTSTPIAIWAPDCRFFAFVALDNEEVLKQTIVKYNLQVDNLKKKYLTSSSFHCSKTGRASSKPALYVYDSFYKSVKKVELPQDGLDYIPMLKWTADPETFAVIALNRNQNHVRMYQVNCKSLMFNAMFEETCTQYYEPRWLSKIFFLPGNKFTFVSDRDGWRHIYLYNANGIQLRQITKGSYDVTDFYGCDTVRNLYYYQAAVKSPLTREVYVSSEDGRQTCLTPDEGVSSARFNPTFTYFMCSNSRLNKPATITVRNTSGKTIREVEKNNATSRSSVRPKELLKIKTPAGDTLYAWLQKPDNFKPSAKYPVVILQNAVPSASNVTDSYSYGMEQILAANGYVVLMADVHGSEARGRDWRKYSYQHLGVKESEDLNAVAKFVSTLPYADSRKIGIYGSRLGGYMALMAMTYDTSVFTAGVLDTPVADLRLYESCESERYMRRPQENSSFNSASPLKRLKSLKAELLLIHGTEEADVQIENTYALSDELVSQSKMFQMMLYPNASSSVFDADVARHKYNTILNFFDSKLK